MASSFGGSCLLRNDGGGVVMSMGTLTRTSEWMRRKIQAWDQTSARFLLHSYMSEYFLPSIYPSSPKYKISELLLAWENAQREHEWHSCFLPDMQFVCRFNHSVDHLQLPVLWCEEHVKSASLKFLTHTLTDARSNCGSTSYWTEVGGYFGLRASALTFCSCTVAHFDVSLQFYGPNWPAGCRRVSREGRKVWVRTSATRNETRRHKLCMHTCTHPYHVSVDI